MINLQLTKEQFTTLLELVYLGETVVNGYREEPFEEYTDLQELLFKLAPMFGVEDVSDEEISEYPSDFFEEGLQDHLEEFEQGVFVERLVISLTDLVWDHDYPDEKVEGLTNVEKYQLYMACQERVKTSLAENGLPQFTLNSIGVDS